MGVMSGWCGFQLPGQDFFTGWEFSDRENIK